MKTSKGKIVRRTEPNEFKHDNGILYYRMYTLDNGERISLGSKDVDPKWGKEGMEIEYEQNGYNKNGNPKYKRVTQNSYTRGQKQVLSIKEVMGMVRSNAIHAVVTINANHKDEVLKGDSLSKIEEFTLGGISEDIEKWGSEHNLLTGRLAAVNNASIASGFLSLNDGSDVAELAKKYFNYTSR